MMLQNIFALTCKMTIITCSCLLLAGCAGFVIESEPSEEVSSFVHKAKELKLGMTRAELHATLGKPYLSSKHVKLEVFQFFSERKEHEVMVLPIPFWMYSNQVYTPVLLVTYNDDWTVKDYKWDIYDEIEKKYILLEIDGYTLLYSTPEITGMILLASAEISEQAVLRPAPDDHCVLYVILPDYLDPITMYTHKLFLNDEPLIRQYFFPREVVTILNIPFQDALKLSTENVFIALELHEGVHEIEFRFTGSKFVNKKFSCVAGKTTFTNLEAESTHQQDWKWYHYEFEGEISISDHWPKEIKDYRQILIYDDKWYGLDYQK